MLSQKECAEGWKVVCKVYKETIDENLPELTLSKIVEELGFDITKEIFATIAELKKDDGRLTSKDRDYLAEVRINPDSCVYGYGNPVIHSGIDDIHTSHIHNLISELMLMEKVMNQ